MPQTCGQPFSVSHGLLQKSRSERALRVSSVSVEVVHMETRYCSVRVDGSCLCERRRYS